MIEPKVQGEYQYEDKHLHITTDSGQSFDISGESADRMAENIDVSEGRGKFVVAENDWNEFGRRSFR